MSFARFHTICDKCGSKGAEYLAHTLVCHECLDDVCEECAEVYDPDAPGYAMCCDCAKEHIHESR